MPSSSISPSSFQRLDPSTPGNVIRVAFAFESLVTIAGGSYLMFFPRHFFISTMRTSPMQVTTTAIQCIQYFGTVNIVLGTALGLLVSNTTTNVVEKRKMLYLGLLGIEIGLAPQLLWQALMMEGGIPSSSLLIWASQLVPLIAWRIVAFGWKKEWFGEYRDGKKEN